jgi:hypothetical protein
MCMYVTHTCGWLLRIPWFLAGSGLCCLADRHIAFQLFSPWVCGRCITAGLACAEHGVSASALQNVQAKLMEADAMLL